MRTRGRKYGQDVSYVPQINFNLICHHLIIHTQAKRKSESIIEDHSPPKRVKASEDNQGDTRGHVEDDSVILAGMHDFPTHIYDLAVEDPRSYRRC